MHFADGAAVAESVVSYLFPWSCMTSGGKLQKTKRRKPVDKVESQLS